jgi:hypothetical protein
VVAVVRMMMITKKAVLVGAGDAYSAGVTGNGAETGTITFVVPSVFLLFFPHLSFFVLFFCFVLFFLLLSLSLSSTH